MGYNGELGRQFNTGLRNNLQQRRFCCKLCTFCQTCSSASRCLGVVIFSRCRCGLQNVATVPRNGQENKACSLLCGAKGPAQEVDHFYLTLDPGLVKSKQAGKRRPVSYYYRSLVYIDLTRNDHSVWTYEKHVMYVAQKIFQN